MQTISTNLTPQADFSEITLLIVATRVRAVQAVNTTLIDLYLQVGQTISQKIALAQWGDGVVAQLLKIGRFEPEYLGKLGFYLEALHRDVKKPHEQPAIGVLLCASKDDEVVEYALSRGLSPALIAQYQTQLPDKALLQAKLHEFYLQSVPSDDAPI
jgi:hypothetical protein